MWGLIPGSVEDITPPSALAWSIGGYLSPQAKLLAVRLANDSCALSGEVIADLELVISECGLVISDDVEADADFARWMDELLWDGVLSHWRIHGSHIYAGFRVDDAAYYGDDTSPPADWDPAAEIQYRDEGDDEAAYEDPDPRRHRIFSKTNYRCFYCTVAWAEHLDHMWPKSRDGSDADENMIGACSRCNIQKRDRTVEEYRSYLSHKHKVAEGFRVRFYGERADA